MITGRTSLRWAGVLFLLAFFAYGGGMGLASRALESPELLAAQAPSYLAGLVLMGLNTPLVVWIGILCFRPLAPHSRFMARFYLLTRIGEGLALLVGTLILGLLLRGSPTLEGMGAAQHGHFLAYHLGMSILGVGSAVWCGFLFRRRVIPRWLAGGGVAGYGVFALGSLLALGGAGDGLLASVPGGLFEVVFATWLLVRPSSWATRHPESAQELP